MKLPSNLRTAALRVSAAGSKDQSHHSTLLLHKHCWALCCDSRSREPSVPNWMHTSPHFAQHHSVRVCAEGLVGITAPVAWEDSSIPGGEGILTGGDIKAGTRGNEEWEKNSLSPPLEDVLPKMQDSGNNRECERERDAQASKEFSYPWAGKSVFCFLFGLFMLFF